ncbi:D-tyrosyl-tRNA(Tyr) deacylase [Coemansia sp. Benny D115]|nr:D-tyrosyl-tRNA(Tyr) deacylase [Coemansia sp. Benny D115]
MRAVLQKVVQASVTVNDQIVGKIGPGICVLVGINQTDTQQDMDYIINKLLNVRVFEDPNTNSMWKKSVKDMDYQILLVSQFTLYGKTTKGSKPDFHEAMKSVESKEFFNRFVQKMGQMYKKDKIETGEFGAMMQVALVNDGPVTLQIDSRKFTYEKTESNKKQDEANQRKAEAKEQRRNKFNSESKTINGLTKTNQVDTQQDTAEIN